MPTAKCLGPAGAVAAGIALLSGIATAQGAPCAIVPIRQFVIRPVGTPRFSVTLLVNGVPVETGLGTGPVGLRVLRPTVERARIPGQGPAARYGYGSGVELDRHRAEAALRIGGIGGQVALQAIDRVSCPAARECPADRVSRDAYGLMDRVGRDRASRPSWGSASIRATSPIH